MESAVPRLSKDKILNDVVPAAGVVGLTLSMASGASAAVSTPAADAAAQDGAPRPDIALGLHEEEVSDVSLATFFVFDDEMANPTQGLVQQAYVVWRGCRGCRVWRGCRGCRCGCRGCRCGCGGCGGCRC
ncbi:hypothetical protein M446_3968 [Methylobacterium sp. 4-46]|nr:hypothetical protein M446_3968 [Methylobacterium sp. 4-46]